jgi:hypothetical protein
MRGDDFTEIREINIQNAKKLNIPIRIVSVITKGVNDSDIGNIFEYVGKENYINNLWMPGYMYLGSCGFSPSQEFVTDELVETVSKNSRGLFTMEDSYYTQKLFYILSAFVRVRPPCGIVAPMFIPRGNRKSVRDIFQFDKFSKVFDEFEKIWKVDHQRAKNYFLWKCLPKFFSGPDFYYLYKSLKDTGSGSSGPPPFKNYYLLTMFTSSNLANCDMESIKERCGGSYSINSGVGTNISRCYELFIKYTKQKTG